MLSLIFVATLCAARSSAIETKQVFPRKPSGELTTKDYGTFTANLSVVQIADRQAFSITTQGEPLRAYFGNLHAHTAQSDGTGDPQSAIRFAKTVARLDFFALTDHSEYWELAPRTIWQQQKRLAELNTDETFIVLPGFEYSHPVFGHYVVLNSRHSASSVSYPRLSDFYQWLAADEDALAIFAHPGFHESLAAEFAGYSFDEAVLNQIIGIEVLHWDGYRRFIETPTGTPYIDQASIAGWRVGSIAAQDNHGADWGLAGNNRVGVLMPSLSRENLVAALKERRFFATNSPALQLSTELCQERTSTNCAQMGGVYAPQPDSPMQLLVNFFDPNGTELPRLEVLLDGAVIATRTPDVLTESWTIAITPPQDPGPHWLYVRLYQGDRGFTQSSPIQIKD